MKHQVIVSIERMMLFPQENQRQFPFSWISAHGEHFGEIIDRLKKYAIRDFLFTVEESEKLGVEVLKAFRTHYKAVTISFNDQVFLSISILDEAEIQAREEEVFALMMGNTAVDRSKMH